MSPTWTIPIELYTGEDIVGNKTVWYETILGTMTTLMIQSTLDAYKSGGLKEAVLAGGFEFFGGSSQTYASKDNTRRKKYSEIKSLLRASPVRAELELNKWNREHPNDQILLSRVQASLNKSTGVKPIPKIPRKPYY